MGYFGSDTFESDYSLCVLGDLLSPFVKIIEKNAQDPDTSQWDEILIDELVISAKILIILMEAGFPIEVLPDSQILKKNRSKFAKRWREGAQGDAFQIERLARILEVWDNMIKVSKALEDGYC